MDSDFGLNKQTKQGLILEYIVSSVLFVLCLFLAFSISIVMDFNSISNQTVGLCLIFSFLFIEITIAMVSINVFFSSFVRAGYKLYYGDYE